MVLHGRSTDLQIKDQTPCGRESLGLEGQNSIYTTNVEKGPSKGSGSNAPQCHPSHADSNLTEHALEDRPCSPVDIANIGDLAMEPVKEPIILNTCLTLSKTVSLKWDLHLFVSQH